MRVVRSLVGAVTLLAGASPGAAFQADLVPAAARARGVQGTISITGPDALVHIAVTHVNDANGDAVDATLVAELRVRDNGRRRRIAIPLPVSGGSGTASQSLGLQPGDALIVNQVRLRGPDRRLIAEMGDLTAMPARTPPPPPEQCPAALASCQSDLDDCKAQLDACESN